MQKKPEDATIEDLKLTRTDGLAINRYIVTVSVPKPNIRDPKPNQGISLTSLNRTTLSDSVLNAIATVVTKVTKTRVTLEFTVAESRLPQFLKNLCKVEGAAIIIGEANE
jgi:hypothetical protein